MQQLLLISDINDFTKIVKCNKCFSLPVKSKLILANTRRSKRYKSMSRILSYMTRKKKLMTESQREKGKEMQRDREKRERKR